MKNTKSLSFLKLSVKQQKALKQRRADNAKKSAEYLERRRAAREASNGPLQAALSPKSKLLVLKNTGTNYSFMTMDRAHAIQLREFVTSGGLDALIPQIGVNPVVDVNETDDQE